MYSFAVPNGSYVVNLYFAEIYSGNFGVGRRVFDVLIEGQLVSNNLDIYSQVGANAALVKSYAVTVSDGQLNIEFLHVVENPKISAIEVISSSSSDTAPPSIPTGLSGNPVSSTQIDLGWNASTDTGGSGLAGYRVYRGGVQVGTTSLTTFSDTGLSPNTTYTYTVSAYDNALNESVQSGSVDVTTLLVANALIRVNAGGGAYTDGNGNGWSTDSGYNTGNTTSTSSPISGTTNDALYQSERWDSGGTPELMYSFAVPNGDYTVNLLFAETYSGAFGVGLRVFDVLIEGQLVANNLDIYSQVGANAALMKSYAVTVSDGQLNIEFLHVVENPKVSAIEVLSTSSISLPFLDNFDDGNADGWIVVDESPYPSDWQVINGQYYQQNSIGFGDTLLETYHQGTYSYFAAGLGLTDYRVTITLTPLSGIDDVGVIFRYKDNNNFYRISFNSGFGFARLEKKYLGQFKTLAKNARGYFGGQPLVVDVEVFTIVGSGTFILVYLNDDPLFSIFDDKDIDIESGTVALYSQENSKFDDVLIEQVSPDPSIIISTPSSYSIETTDTLNMSAIVTNMPLNGSVEFVLYDDSMSVVDSAVDSTFPYTAQFRSVSQGEHTLDAILRDGSNTAVASDTNIVIGILGDYYFAVGDSITFGYHDNITNNLSQDQRIYSIQGGYESKLNDLLTNTRGYPHIIFNEGVPGDKTADMRIDSILERHPGANLVLILLGTNDALSRVPDGQGCSGTSCDGTFNGNMQTLLDKVVTQAGKKAYVALIPPIFTSPVNPLSSTSNSYVQVYNSIITNLINNTPNVEAGPDLFTFFLGSGTYLNLYSLFSDALHPNALGHLVMAYLWHKAITGIGGPPFILNNLSPSTVIPFLKQNLLEAGNKYYVDEAYTLTSIPTGLGLANGRWIMAANSDLGNTGSTYLSFDVDRSVTVYVAYDSGAATIPDWLSSSKGFASTGYQLGTSNPSVPTMDLYSKTYTAGAISLGGNQADGATGAANYIVIVVEN